MLSDVLSDAAEGIREYRKDYPAIYGQDPRMNLWLDAITAQLGALAQAVGMAPPPDDRTITGECQNCHEITTISLGRLSCQPCADRLHAMAQELLEQVYDGDPAADPELQARKDAERDAEHDAAHAERLTEDALRIVSHLKQLSRADRDYILAAVDRGLMEAL